MDFQNLLRRCGQPTEVSVPLDDRSSRAAWLRIFNENAQIDGFQFKGSQYLLMIDEATRYKVTSRT